MSRIGKAPIPVPSGVDVQITDGNIILLLSMLGLDDPTGASDSDFRIAWLTGQDADVPADPSDNFSGSETFLVAPDALLDGAPRTTVQSRVMSSMLRSNTSSVRAQSNLTGH